MDLLEYQAKELFHRVGIPILPSQPIANLSEIKHLQIPYPVVLKSQVRSGGRGRAGGIRFVENTIDAIAAAQAIFSLAILGEYPEVILAEARYDTQSEFFLSVLLDYQLQRPVLLGSTRGGIEVETLLKNIEKVVVDGDFSPFYARRLATKMGLKGALIPTVSSIIEKMYQIFVEKDLDWIEINPLAVSPTGEVMALDGKIAVNDAALFRHEDLVALLTPQKSESSLISLREVEAKSFSVIEASQKDGKIAMISNGWGLTLTTWDLFVNQKVNPACAWILNEQEGLTALGEQLTIALKQAMKLTHLRVILVNVLGDANTSEAVAQVVADCCQPYLNGVNNLREDRLPRPTGTNAIDRQRGRQSQGYSVPFKELPPLVVRLVGGNFEPIKESLCDLPIDWVEDLEEAIAKTISLITPQKK